MNKIISAWNELGVSTKQNNTKFHRENNFTEKSKQQSCHHFKAKIAAGLAHGIKYQKTIVWYGSIKRVQ